MPYASRQPRSVKFLSCEELETRLCLSEVVFATHVIASGYQAGSRSVHVADIDGDGDMDVLADAKLISTGREATIVWYENTDGRGHFGPQRVITAEVTSRQPVYAADVDGDGDVDVLLSGPECKRNTGAPQLVSYENLQLAPGDANRDLQFDQQDVEQVLLAAKYRTGEPATFEEGDWNSDGVFDQLDIVEALQTGNYLQGPYAADALFATIGG